MKYQQPTFTLPAGSNKVTQEEWDRIFNEEENTSVLLPEVFPRPKVEEAEECLHARVGQKE